MRSISLLKLTVDLGAGIAGKDFFFCDPPFGGGGGAGGANVGATFDSLIIAWTIGFCDSR
jgi:hypothetical protein